MYLNTIELYNFKTCYRVERFVNFRPQKAYYRSLLLNQLNSKRWLLHSLCYN